jgi:hypothetical protein
MKVLRVGVIDLEDGRVWRTSETVRCHVQVGKTETVGGRDGGGREAEDTERLAAIDFVILMTTASVPQMPPRYSEPRLRRQETRSSDESKVYVKLGRR